MRSGTIGMNMTRRANMRSRPFGGLPGKKYRSAIYPILEEKDESDDNQDKTDSDQDKADDAVLSDDMKKQLDAEAAKDPKNGKKLKAVAVFLAKMLNSASSSAIASIVDNFTLGNMKEAVCDIYKKKLEKMGEDDVDKVGKELRAMPEFQKAKKQYVDSGKRQDDNTNTEIDETSIMCKCAWYSHKKEQNLLKILNELVVGIQKQAKSQGDQIKELKAKVKSMKIEGVGDQEVDAFGPIISNMISDNKSAAEIAKKVGELKAGVKESYQQKIYRHKRRLLSEGKEPIITEAKKRWIILETICNTREFQENLTRYLISEGFFKKAIAGIKGAAGAVKDLAKGQKNGESWKVTLGKIVDRLPSKFSSKLKSVTNSALETLKNGGLAPILKIAGIGLLAVSGAWGVALIISTMMLIEKHGKQLKYAFDYAWSSFANSKGVVSQFDFKTKGGESKYSARFYAKDATWRVINISNQNKHPNKDFAKAILTGDFGKKFSNRAVELWDPVFSPDKGGKIDFSEILKQSKALTISDKQLAMLNDFKKAYPQIRANMLKPQIDTRTQEL